MFIKVIREYLSSLNRRRKYRFQSSYVTRTKFEEINRKYNYLIDCINSIEKPFENQPEIRCVCPMSFDLNVKEVCLFVSYSPAALIKPHVLHHIKALRSENIEVVLVINTDNVNTDLEHLKVHDLDLAGLYIRPNVGFDFGAWSQLYNMLESNIELDRLYLVNDSMIGPLSDHMFKLMINKIHQSSADHIGLVANVQPLFHLQSYFLVFNKCILQDKRFNDFFKKIWCLPTKGMVVDFYEVRMTQLIQNMGFKVESLYRVEVGPYQKTDLVFHNLDDLLAIDFPYIKKSMLDSPKGMAILARFPSCLY